MKIHVNVPNPMGQDLMRLQEALGCKRIEDLTIHALCVLRYLMTTIGPDCSTLSPEAIQWILQSPSKTPLTESSQEGPVVSHTEIDSRIRQEIHHLLDDNQIDQALKVTRIFKLLKPQTTEDSDSHLVKSEMLLTAAETFVEESDPEKAAQLIMDATHETHEKP